MSEQLSKFEQKPIEIKEQIKNSFMDYYQGVGYRYSEPIPLIPEDIDKSVAFTGATINGWKKYLNGEDIPVPGIYTIQPCLRNHNVKNIYDVENIPSFDSFFYMAGILAPANRRSVVSSEINVFLLDKIGLDPSEIKVQLPSKHLDLISQKCEFDDLGIDTAVDEIDWYDWQYGMDGVVGRGLTYMVKNPTSGRFEEIGNSVIISKDNTDIAVEWGFGLETFSSRVCGALHPIYSSDVLKYLPHNITNTVAGLRLADTTEALSAIYASGFSLKADSPENNRLVKKYIRGLCYLCSILDISIGEQLSIIEKFSKERFGVLFGHNTGETLMIIDYFKKFSQRKQRFEESVRAIMRNPINETKKRENVIKSLQLTATNNGIHDGKQATGIVVSSVFYNEIDQPKKDIIREAFSKLI